MLNQNKKRRQSLHFCRILKPTTQQKEIERSNNPHLLVLVTDDRDSAERGKKWRNLPLGTFKKTGHHIRGRYVMDFFPFFTSEHFGCKANERGGGTRQNLGLIRMDLQQSRIQKASTRTPETMDSTTTRHSTPHLDFLFLRSLRGETFRHVAADIKRLTK